MDQTLLFPLALSVALPMAPLVMSYLLMRRALKVSDPSLYAMAAAGMAQILSLLWLLKAMTKLPLFFSATADAAELKTWIAVNYEAGPYLSFAVTLLAGVFWLLLRKLQKKQFSSK